MFDDDDQFELNDELLAASDTLVHAVVSEETNEVLLFNCSGDDSHSSQFHFNSFLRNHDFKYDTSPAKKKYRNKTLFNITFNESSVSSAMMANSLFNKSRVNVQILDAASCPNSTAISNKSPFVLRSEVTEFLSIIRMLLRQNMLNLVNVIKGLESLRLLLGSVESLPISNVLHSANHINGNICTSPVYHFMHGNLEWRWLHLTIMLEIERMKECEREVPQSLANTQFELHLRFLLTDLIKMSICKYNKLKNADLLYTTPFPCTCIKELWLLVQLFVDNLSENNRITPFWSHFNCVLNKLRDSSDFYQSFELNNLKRKPVESLKPNNWTQFSLWLLCGVSKLYGFSTNGEQLGPNSLRIKDNYELLDILTKLVLSSGFSEEQLRVCLFLLAPFIAEWWPPHTDTLMTFWEYFHGKLNSPFYIPGAAPDSLAVAIPSVVDFIKHIKNRLDSCTVNPNDTSFSIFVILLGKVLQRLRIVEGSNQIRKVLGRITSKFSVSKLLALNETGINNMATILTTLAVSTDLAEMAQRCQNFLAQIPLPRLASARQTAIVRGHVALILVFFDQKLDCHNFIVKMLDQVNSAHLDEGYILCLKIVSEGFCEIFCKSQNYDRGEVMFIDSWIVKYLSSSSRPDEQLLECLNETLRKIETILSSINETNSSFRLLLDAFYKQLMPYIKQSFLNKETSNYIPKIAANLCLLVKYNSNSGQEFEELFQFFIDSPTKNIQNVIEFLVLISLTNRIDSINETTIISQWIRCNLCCGSINNSLKALTSIVVILNEFNRICDADTTEIVSSNEPLCEFFAEIGKTYQATMDFNKKCWMIERMSVYLKSFDKYISILEVDDFKVYSMIGIIIFHCAPLVYIKARSSCFFNVAFCQFIMPTDILMGKEPREQKTRVIHKIWNLLINGIEKLDFKNDNHINKILINLIVKWFPNFKILTNKISLAKPFVLCMRENTETMSCFVFEKISSAFLTLHRRFADRHATLALTMLMEVFRGISDSEEKLKILLKSSLMTIIEHTLMVDDTCSSKSLTFEFLSLIFANSTYRSSSALSEISVTILQTITTKHLSYYSTIYFQFLFRLIKINVEVVRAIMSHLKDQISTVEQLRGMGRDAKLRSEYDRLEGAIGACVNT